MSFWYHCKEHTFSFNVIPKSSSYSSYFLRYARLCKRHLKRFLWKCDFEKWTFKVSYSYSFGFNRLQKMWHFWLENVWKSVRNYKNQKIVGWFIFHPFTICNCPYLKIGMCDLFLAVLLECITNMFLLIFFVGVSGCSEDHLRASWKCSQDSKCVIK